MNSPENPKIRQILIQTKGTTDLLHSQIGSLVLIRLVRESVVLN